MERGETAYDAARREAEEEVGLTGLDLVFLTTLQRTQGADPIDERVDFFFTCRRWSGEPRIVEPGKCADLRWWPLHALPDPVSPTEQAVLDALPDGVAPYLTLGF